MGICGWLLLLCSDCLSSKDHLSLIWSHKVHLELGLFTLVPATFTSSIESFSVICSLHPLQSEVYHNSPSSCALFCATMLHFQERRPRTEPLNRLSLGTLGARNVSRGSGLLSKTGKSMMLANAMASPRTSNQTSKTVPNESKLALSKHTKSIKSMTNVVSAMSPRKTDASFRTSGLPGGAGGESPVHRTMVLHELKNIAREAGDVSGDPEEWMQMLTSESRQRHHAQESLLPLLDDEQLHDFVRRREASFCRTLVP